jgi:peptidyl-prolyl cis-trans isomerase D
MMFYKLRFTLIIVMVLAAATVCAVDLKTNPKGIVGKIDNKTYTLSEFNGILSNYISYYESREGKLSAERKKELNDRCWEELIGRAVYDNEIKRRRLAVSDQEAMDLVLKTPPVQVQQIKELQTDGKFDNAKFKQALDGNAQFKTSVIDLVKESMIYDKLFDVIKAQAKAKPDSVKNAWVTDNNIADAKVIFFDMSKQPEQPVENSETISYYNKNRETYKKDPARKYRFVKINADKYVKVKADSIYNALKNGADFAALATKYSQDPGSGKNGGDLGWFTKGRMVKPFEDAAFNTELNTITEPVKTQFGYHIVQPLEKRKNDKGEDEVHARHILIKSEATDSMKVLMQKEADELLALVKTKGLVKAALDLNLTVEETNEFYEKDKGIREIGQFPELITAAFTNDLGYTPATVSGRTGEIFVTELSDSMGIHFSPLEKEKNTIVRTLEREKRIAYNKARAREFYDKNAGTDYIEAAQRDSLKIVEAKDLKASGSIPEIGVQKALVDSILAMESGQYTSIVENDQNAFLALVTRRVKPDLKVWEKQKGKLLAEANDKVKTSQLNTWYYNQRQKLKIEDNRKEYFELPKPKTSQQQIQLSPQ